MVKDEGTVRWSKRVGGEGAGLATPCQPGCPIPSNIRFRDLRWASTAASTCCVPGLHLIYRYQKERNGGGGPLSSALPLFSFILSFVVGGRLGIIFDREALVSNGGAPGQRCPAPTPARLLRSATHPCPKGMGKERLVEPDGQVQLLLVLLAGKGQRVGAGWEGYVVTSQRETGRAGRGRRLENRPISVRSGPRQLGQSCGG